MKGFMLIFCSLLIAFGATAQSKLGSQTPKKSIFMTHPHNSFNIIYCKEVSSGLQYNNSCGTIE